MTYSGHAKLVRAPAMHAQSHWITHSSVMCQMWSLRRNDTETGQRSSDKLVTEKNAEAQWMITEKNPIPNRGLLANLFPHSSATTFPKTVFLLDCKHGSNQLLSIQIRIKHLAYSRYSTYTYSLRWVPNQPITMARACQLTQTKF